MKPHGILAIATTGILLGTIPLFADVLGESLSSGAISLARVAVALLCVATFAFIGNVNVRISWRHVGTFIGYGLVSVALVNYLYIKSLACTTTAIASVTVFVSAPVTTIIGDWLLGTKTGTRNLLYITLIIIGCVLVNASPQDSVHDQHMMGMLYATLCGVCFGLFSLFGKKLAKDYGYPVMMFWQFLIATVATGIALIAFDISAVVSIAHANQEQIGAMVGIGVVATFLPYYLYSYGLKNGVEPSTASALTLLEPVSACLLAVIFMGEHMSAIQTVGIGTVLGGCLILGKTKTTAPARRSLPT
jgi:DME family drug/metabolite transporter